MKLHFVTPVAAKTKYRNKLRVQGGFGWALTGIKPRIKDLVVKSQCQLFHQFVSINLPKTVFNAYLKFKKGFKGRINT